VRFPDIESVRASRDTGTSASVRSAAWRAFEDAC
jgi:hypothetical protein